MKFWNDEGNEWEADYLVSKACLEGKEAFKKGIRQKDNPYPEKSFNGRDWISGWKVASLQTYFTHQKVPAFS